jgi:hypothetical protein
MANPPTHNEPTPSTPAAGAFIENTAPTQPDFAEAVAKGYEPKDIGLRAVFTFIGVLAVTLFVVLSVVYGIMMALADYDRSTDPLASPVAVKLPRVYAPLQPSLGFYGNDANNHKELDSEDMILMREQAAAALNAPAGTTAAGRSHMPIASAIDRVLPLLVQKPVIAAVVEPEYPVGSFEGHVGGTQIPPKKPGVWSNDMNSLNNLGN